MEQALDSATAVAAPDIGAVLEAAQLTYSRPCDTGYRREGRPEAFRYVDEHGRVVRRPAVLARIKTLAIPPAWTSVWICADAQGHLQAVGRDARGRMQYRYHADWRAQRDQHKFHRMVNFARKLPAIRQAVERDLHTPGLNRRKLLAAMVCILDRTFMRVGDERSFDWTSFRIGRRKERPCEEPRCRGHGLFGNCHEVRVQNGLLRWTGRRGPDGVCRPTPVKE